MAMTEISREVGVVLLRARVGRRLPGSRITLILAGAHGIQYTHGHALAEAIREFVEEQLGD